MLEEDLLIILKNIKQFWNSQHPSKNCGNLRRDWIILKIVQNCFNVKQHLNLFTILKTFHSTVREVHPLLEKISA